MPSPFESETSFREALKGAFSPFELFRQAWEAWEGPKKGGSGGSDIGMGAFLFPMEKLLGKTFAMMEQEINQALRQDIYAPRAPQRPPRR